MSKEFKIVNLGDVCTKASSNISLNKVADNIGEYALFGASGFAMNIDFYHQEKEYIAIVKDGAGAGRVMMLPPKSSIVGTMQYILPKSNIDINYLCYFLKQLDLAKYASGATIPHIYFKDYSKEEIFLPSIVKQQEIAAVLDKASELVEKRKAQLAELDALAESIFYDMFGDPVTNEKGWDTEILRKLTTKIGSGATPKGGNESYKDEGISLIRSLNVHNGVFKYKDLAHIDDEQAAALNNVTIECNDVLLNITGASVARCCIVPSDVLPARVNQHVAIVRVIKDLANYRFLCSQLTSIQYQRKLLDVGRSSGATREALTKANVESLNVILPPLQLQQQFAERIEKIEQQKQKVKTALKESEDLFQRLMQDMFNPEYHNS